MLDEKIKNIISGYIKIPVDQINAQTRIDRSAVANSILLHRMYASLQKEGIVIDNYLDTRTYGSLLEKLHGKQEPGVNVINGQGTFNYNDLEDANLPASVGIDIEEIGSMPQVKDFREDKFYTMNFSSSEIAYCILQPNTLSSFAGLFAAKEAIVKADNTYKNWPFNAIIINHNPTGKPTHPNLKISISHAPSIVVAIAINTIPFPERQNTLSASGVCNNTKSISLLHILSFTAIILSVIAILLCISKK